MLWLFVVLFIVVPLAELWAIIAVSDIIGGWPTIGLLLFDSLLGAWLLKRQGRGVLAKVDARLRANQLPTDELVDGVLILFAGALMLTPGFITDAAGFLLLLPFTRAPLRRAEAPLHRSDGPRVSVCLLLHLHGRIHGWPR